MKSRTISTNKNRLDNVFALSKKLPQEAEILSHWAKYLCVLVSGFIETSVCAIYEEYTENKAAPPIANFVADKLEYFQNPSMNKIFELVKSFNSKWEQDLRTYTQGELGESVNGIVNNRNKIAHGENVGITYATVQTYYQNVLKVIEFMENQCNP
jgi:RiboL-PSP-HEPN